MARAKTKGKATRQTPAQKAEAELTKFGLTFPETTAGPAWVPARGLYMRTKMFFVFGDKKDTPDQLTMIMKLPISAEMAQELPFVRPSGGWMKQHNWIRAHFGPDDDVLAEMATLKGWLKQSYTAVAPKTLGRLLE